MTTILYFYICSVELTVLPCFEYWYFGNMKLTVLLYFYHCYFFLWIWHYFWASLLLLHKADNAPVHFTADTFCTCVHLLQMVLLYNWQHYSNPTDTFTKADFTLHVIILLLYFYYTKLKVLLCYIYYWYFRYFFYMMLILLRYFYRQYLYHVELTQLLILHALDNTCVLLEHASDTI